MLKSKDVYRLDINSRWLGVNTELLMENAGKSVADVIFEKYPTAKKIVCICSRTNNGGDGLVAARHLSARYDVIVIFIGDPETIKTAETRKNWQRVYNLHTVKKVIIKYPEDLKILEDIIKDADIIIDAIFGVGVKGKPKGLEGETIAKINALKEKYGFKIISVDVPSGFDTEEGKPSELMINADVITTFHAMKHGLEKLGREVIIKHIGIPKDSEIFVGPGDFIEFIRERDPWSHKGDFGRILVIGGSEHYTGAPALSAMAALRTGADLSIIYAPEAVASTIRSFSPNVIAESYPGKFFNEDSMKRALELSEKASVVIVGPGLGSESETLKTTYKFITELAGKKPLVVDADALKSLAKYGIPRSRDIIITPHAGEFKLIFGEEPSKDLYMRGELVKKHAKALDNVTILLKGHIDVISDGDRLLFNRTGNPGMTVGGTGDVLTGIVAAIRAQCSDSFKSAAMGAFLCGFAGDLAFEKYGYCLTATDVIEQIPVAIREIRRIIYQE
ncbi:MAG: NAD(P)H-hydrate dehydratase [Candidatus Korarchaeota archaeon]